MDSFFLAETLKYLYLLFSEDNDLTFDIDDFILTTEAHIIPLSLANTETSAKDIHYTVPVTCPNIKLAWLEVNIYHKLLVKQCSASRYLYPLDESIISNR